MYVRLAFAVAINVDPDILIVDEALSVGDEAFQRKCIARIDAIRASGASVLFVSHSAGTVVELCDRAVLLDRGECLSIGAPKQVLARYQRLVYAPADKVPTLRDEMRARLECDSAEPMCMESAVEPDSGDEALESWYDPTLLSQEAIGYVARGAEIADARLETLDGRRVNVVAAGESYAYTFRVHFARAAVGVRFGMLFKTVTGVELAGAVTALPEQALATVEAGATIQVRFRFRCLLAPGVYFANAGVLALDGEGEQFLDRRLDIAMFRVLGRAARLATGHVDLRLGHDIELVPSLEMSS
jgi:lipopolysaccharide transport system ATP-binding protein